MNAGLLLVALGALVLIATPGAARALALSAGQRELEAPPVSSGSNGKWQLPPAAAPYATAILEAEARYNLPHLLLGRVLYEESRFRPDIIAGTTPSPTGAIGIAQFEPDTAAELGVNPYDPYESIDGAGMYLASLYDQFGDWTSALIAYNWGMGHVRRLGVARAPAESRRYASAITGDVGVV